MTQLFYVQPEFDKSDWYVKTAPTSYPVTLEEVKDFAKVSGSAEDALIQNFIAAATDAVEGILGRALINRTIVLRMDEWPQEFLTLPRPPLVSITQIRTLDESGAATIYDAANYYVVAGDSATVAVKNGCTVPENTNRYHRGFEIEYVAGYGSAASYVPAAIKLAIMHWVANMYETRVPDLTNPPAAVEAALIPYRILKA